MELTIFLTAFAVLFILGIPLAWAMIIPSWIYIYITDGSIAFLSMSMFTSLKGFILVAIPMFMLTAEIMEESKVADRLFNFANSVFGFIPGGLGHVNVVTSTIFSGMSGSALADIGGIGHLSCVAMTKRGFDKPFSGAVTSASACIGPIIPPSIPMVLYAMISQVSLGKLLLGGIIPGLLMSVGFMVCIYFISVKRNYPIEPKQSFPSILKLFLRGLLPMLTPGILLGGILLGLVTITEAAVLAVLYTLMIGFFAYRTLGIYSVWRALKRVFNTCAPVLILFPAIAVFGYVMAIEQIPTKVSNLFLYLENPWLILFAINLLFLILGTFADVFVNIILFVPIVLPLAQQINMDPVHFGVMIILNIMIGLLTPPVGGLSIIVSSVEEIPYHSLIKESWPFIGMLLIILFLIAAYPPFVTFIPNLFFK